MLNFPFSKRYGIGLVVWIIAFVGSLELVAYWSEQLAPGSPQRLALSLLPLVVLCFALRLDFELYQKMDEMQRQMLFTSLTVSLYAVVLASAAGVLLEEVGGMQRLSTLWLLGVGAVGSLVGWWMAWRRYQ